ncbi:17869_t:CDS:2, partial [Racocetra fulgida]
MENPNNFAGVDAMNLKLWKAEIPINSDNTIQGPTLDNELFPANDIGEYWKETLSKKHIIFDEMKYKKFRDPPSPEVSDECKLLQQSKELKVY